jgi:hypothetical protein
MNTTIKTGFLLMVIFIANSGCSLPRQSISDTWYNFHDLKIVDEEVLVILEKERAKSNVSIAGAIMGEYPGTAYSRCSDALLLFDKNDFNSVSNKEISLKEKKDIVTQKRVRGELGIIDKNKIISTDDIINDKPNPSVIYLNNGVKSRHVAEDSVDFGKSIITFSFDRKKFFHITNKRMFIFDVDTFETKELVSDIYKENFFEQFAHTRYLSNDGNLFFDYSYNDPRLPQQNGVEYKPYKFTIINKKTNEVAGILESKFRVIKALNENNKMVLVKDSSLGFEIVDINGNSLYALHDKSLSLFHDAVMHDDKVYAAGLSKYTGEFMETRYIEFLVWDYKNNIIIRKRFPCDKANLDV